MQDVPHDRQWFEAHLDWLTPPEAAWVAWRSTMRTVQPVSVLMPEPLMSGVLRQLLAAWLFGRGEIGGAQLQQVRNFMRQLRKRLDEASPTGFAAHARSGEDILIAAAATIDAFQEEGSYLGYAVDAISRTDSATLVPGIPQAIFEDMAAFTADREDVCVMPLWPPVHWGAPQELLQDDSTIWEPVNLHPFWRDWYRAILLGGDHDTRLPLAVVAIPDAIWGQGGKMLEREIDSIVERHGLLDEVRRLKAELAAANEVAPAITNRGHNRPPELLPDHLSEMTAAIETIADELAEAEEALQEQSPSSSRLKRIGQAIKQAVVAALGYCGEIADIALKEAAKKIGAAAGLGTVAYLVLHGDQLLALAEKLIGLAGKF